MILIIMEKIRSRPDQTSEDDDDGDDGNMLGWNVSVLAKVIMVIDDR